MLKNMLQRIIACMTSHISPYKGRILREEGGIDSMLHRQKHDSLGSLIVFPFRMWTDD